MIAQFARLDLFPKLAKLAKTVKEIHIQLPMVLVNVYYVDLVTSHLVFLLLLLQNENLQLVDQLHVNLVALDYSQMELVLAKSAHWVLTLLLQELLLALTAHVVTLLVHFLMDVIHVLMDNSLQRAMFVKIAQ